MTKKIGQVVVIENTGESECSDCGELHELRPYGKDGAWVCYTCAMKDEAEAERQFAKLFNGSRDI